MASIIKRGKNYKITAYLGYDGKGKQKRKSTTYVVPEGISCKKAFRLAKEYAFMWENEMNKKINYDDNMNFCELADWYYTKIAPRILKEHVIYEFRKCIEDHVMPYIGNMKIKDITTPLLDDMFLGMRLNGNIVSYYTLDNNAETKKLIHDESKKIKKIDKTVYYNLLSGKKVKNKTADKISEALNINKEEIFSKAAVSSGLCAGSVNKIRLNLSAIFTMAVKKEIISKNPCSNTTPQKSVKKCGKYLNQEECRILIDALHRQPDYQFEVIINLFLMTGLRSGELTALQWEDIDLSGGMLKVSHTLTRFEGRYLLTSPKTGKSERYIPLPLYAVKMLSEYKKRMLNNGTLCEGMGNMVFKNQKGSYLCGADLNAKLKKICKANGLPDIHLHSLRHTHASLLINSDVSAKVVAERLGHADIKTTLDIYTHIFEKTRAKAMKSIELQLFK